MKDGIPDPIQDAERDSTRDRSGAMLLGAFVADALALGVHWVYNTRVIDKKFGRVTRYYAPLTSYHKGKKAGEHTHYGDQMLVLLESLEARAGFEPAAFARRWRLFFETYGGYFDHATKDTLHNLSQGLDIDTCGSSSEDLAGASRIAPLCYAHYRDLDRLVEAVRQQTALTHNTPTVIDAAELFARTTVKVLYGTSPVQALQTVVQENFRGNPLETLITDGLESREIPTRQAIADFGQQCNLEAALPGCAHLLAAYEHDLEAALVENVMAGGDSSARGMPVGMILGATHGLKALPGPWLADMATRARITALMQSLDTKTGSA